MITFYCHSLLNVFLLFLSVYDDIGKSFFSIKELKSVGLPTKKQIPTNSPQILCMFLSHDTIVR